MIVKMQKITLLVSEKYHEPALKVLRKLGVVHVNYIHKPFSEDIQSLETEVEKVENALRLISFDNQESPEKRGIASAVEDVNRILSLAQRKDTLERELRDLVQKRQWFDEWGVVSYASLQQLQQAGIHLRFYLADKRAFRKVAADKQIYIVKKEGNRVRIALFADSPEEKLDFKEDKFPDVEFNSLEPEIARIRQELSGLQDELKKLNEARNELLEYDSELKKRLEFDKVRDSMGHDAQIVYLQGYCPLDKVQQIKKVAKREGWGYSIEDPDDPDDVPTLIRNPKWVRVIEPLFQFMGTLPGYKEQDVSFVFLLFFSLFYAMLVGDAGYGLLFLLATFYVARKKKSAPREPFKLMYVLSGTTIVWGVLTGTWFGSEKIAELPLVKAFVIDQIDSFSYSNQSFMMKLTFIIGVVHLSVGRLLAMIQKMNSLKAIAEIGWIAILWGVYFVANSLILANPLPGYVWLLFVIGSALIMVFANFQKNVLKGMIQTISNLPLGIINTFSDVVSYIRLFAVGLATVIVAASFNEMASDAAVDTVSSGLIAALILVFGHALNILLAMMSVLVHGVRLNMLEFSSHVGMKWSGKPYRPFQE
jgi:V/A-type H+-transporting ATPase subunit I